MAGLTHDSPSLAQHLVTIVHISVNARDSSGSSPLHVAAWTNALPVAEALLARGAEVDAVKRDGSTPLHLCASRGLYGMVTILLEAGADKRKTTVSGSTPADRAALFRDDRLVRSLS